MARVTVTALCVGSRRRAARGHGDITPADGTSAANLHRALNIAHAHLLPGEHLEADVYRDGVLVGSWRVRPYGRLPEQMVDTIKTLRAQEAVTV